MRMTARTLHLVGGGPGTMLALRRHFGAALAELARPRPLVAYVGAASNDHRGFYAMIRGGLALGAARMVLAKMASPRAQGERGASSSRGQRHGVRLRRRRRARDEDPARSRPGGRHRRPGSAAGKPIFGISAGSLMLAREWVRFPDENDEASRGDLPLPGDCSVARGRALGGGRLERASHPRAPASPSAAIATPVGYGLTRKGGLRASTVDARGRIAR